VALEVVGVFSFSLFVSIILLSSTGVLIAQKFWFVYTCVYTCMCVCMHKYWCVCKHAFIHVCTNVCVYVCIRVYMYACTHACMHTYIQELRVCKKEPT
jgi:hypothetical protein